MKTKMRIYKYYGKGFNYDVYVDLNIPYNIPSFDRWLVVVNEVFNKDVLGSTI